MIMKPSFDSMLCVPLCCCETGSDTGVSPVAVTFFYYFGEKLECQIGECERRSCFYGVRIAYF